MKTDYATGGNVSGPQEYAVGKQGPERIIVKGYDVPDGPAWVIATDATLSDKAIATLREQFAESGWPGNGKPIVLMEGARIYDARKAWGPEGVLPEPAEGHFADWSARLAAWVAVILSVLALLVALVR